MARVTTRTGDDGTTGLIGRQRVPKNHPRIEVLGALDEANAAIGLARALSDNGRVRAILELTQRLLYQLMADVATVTPGAPGVAPRVTEQDVADIEAKQAELQAAVTLGNRFVVPGETVAGAAIDVARTIVRRAERRVVQLTQLGELSHPSALRLVNRLSDLLFVSARFDEEQHGRRAPLTRDA